MAKELLMDTPNFKEIDRNKQEELTKEERERKIEEFDAQTSDRKFVTEKEKEGMELWEAVLYDEKGNEFIGPKDHKVILKQNKEPIFIPPFMDCSEDKQGNKKYFIKQGVMADYLVNNIPSIFSTGMLYVYDNGVYRETYETEAEGIVNTLLTPEHTSKDKSKSISYLWKIDRRVQKSHSELNSNPYLINLKNGMLDVSDKDNWKFESGHSPKYLSTVRVNGNYNPNIEEEEGKHFLNFLETSVPNKKNQMILQEMLGYCLTPLTTSKKMIFILTGGKDSGKTTFLTSTLTEIIDKNAQEAQTLQDLENKEYVRANLFGKIVNVMADLPSTPLKDISILKTLTGDGDPVPARRLYQAPFSFQNKAKLVFSANNLPANFSKDTTDAFYSRLTLIPFDQKIKKKDPSLKSNLKKEKDFITNWALEGLKRLQEQDFQFTVSEESEAMKAEYQKENNPIMTFVEEYCELDTNNETARAGLYTAWQNYCEINGHHAGSQIKFNKNLDSIYGEYVKKSQMNNSKRTKSWKGIRPLKFDEIG